jgi:signal transduction histidine kinase
MGASHASGDLGTIPDEAAGWTVAALGLALVGVGAAYYAVAPDPTLFTVTVASLPGATTAVGWAGVRRWGVEAEFQPRLLRWAAVGGGVLGGLVLLVFLVQGGPLFELVPLLQFMTGVGTTGGVAIGVNEVRSVRAAREAERARVSAEHVREERDRLRFLNNLLRHNVLNKINVVQAYTRDVAERHDGEFDDELQTALTQSEEIAEVIENVRLLVRTTTEETEHRPVDLAAAVQAAVDSVEDGGATVETDVPTVRVRGDDILKYVVANLVRNAVQHHDGDAPTVRITADTGEDAVTLRVADDGPGIPDARKEEVLLPTESGDGGLGLYLTRTVVEGYGGSVDIEDNEPRGAVVVLHLPLAEA